MPSILTFCSSLCVLWRGLKEVALKEEVALPVLRSSVSVSDIGSVVERSSSVEEEAFVVLPAPSVATVVDTGIMRELLLLDISI